MRFRLKYGTVNMEVKIDLDVTLHSVRQIIQAQTVVCGVTISALGSGEGVKEASDAAIKSLGSAVESFVKKKRELKFSVNLIKLGRITQACQAILGWTTIHHPYKESRGTVLKQIKHDLDIAIENKNGIIRRNLTLNEARQLKAALKDVGTLVEIKVQ